MEIYVQILVRSYNERCQLNNNYYITFIKKCQNNTLIKQTKIENQNKSKPTVALSISKDVTYYECVLKGISFTNLRAPANFHLYDKCLNRDFG